MASGRLNFMFDIITWLAPASVGLELAKFFYTNQTPMPLSGTTDEYKFLFEELKEKYYFEKNTGDNKES